MCINRIKGRIRSTKPFGTASLNGYKLEFNMKSLIDGSGKCSIRHTGDSSDFVHGVLYNFDPVSLVKLDKYEGLGVCYDRLTISVEKDGELFDAITYAGLDDAIVDGVLPYSWYLNYVIEGARQNRLPPEYIAFLESVPSKDDKNLERDSKNRQNA